MWNCLSSLNLFRNKRPSLLQPASSHGWFPTVETETVSNPKTVTDDPRSTPLPPRNATHPEMHCYRTHHRARPWSTRHPALHWCSSSCVLARIQTACREINWWLTGTVPPKYRVMVPVHEENEKRKHSEPAFRNRIRWVPIPVPALYRYRYQMNLLVLSALSLELVSQCAGLDFICRKPYSSPYTGNVNLLEFRAPDR